MINPTPEQERESARRKQEFQNFIHSPEYSAKLVERLRLIDAANRSLKARGYVWHLCERPDASAEGAKFFINTFGWTFDARPEHRPNHLPFITFEYQDELIAWIIDHIENGKDGLVEKSRDMGVTWVVLWVFVWYWLFRDGVNLLVGSYKEALVDDRTDNSMFGRIDYILQSLPKWMLPKKFNKDKHRTKLKLTNVANGNVISGDTMNPDFGRGSRRTAVFFDELGSWDYAKDAWESCGDVTSCRIANSTPKGDNFYARLRKSGIDVITLHWKLHPHKDQLWYQYECSRRSEEEVAQELDISYTKSREGKVYPEWNESNVLYGLYEYDDGLPLYVGWDFGKTDDTAMIWFQPDPKGGYRIIDTYRNRGKNIDFYVPFVTGIINSDGYLYTKEDMEIIAEHRNWKKGTHFGDPAGRFQNIVSDETVIDVLRRYGIIMNFKDKWKEFNVRKSATKRFIMNGVKLNKNPRTEYFDTCIINASYPKVRVEGQEQIRSEKPKHDNTSHYRSALEYACLGLEEMNERRGVVFDKFPKRNQITRTKNRVIGY